MQEDALKYDSVLRKRDRSQEYKDDFKSPKIKSRNNLPNTSKERMS